jgi:hypothetical protein
MLGTWDNSILRTYNLGPGDVLVLGVRVHQPLTVTVTQICSAWAFEGGDHGVIQVISSFTKGCVIYSQPSL